MIRIASGQAFWGDWPQAPALQVRSGPIDYLVLDYLAEVTISILDKQRQRDPKSGFARDFVNDIGELLPEILDRNIKVIASAGGVNPTACAEALLARAKQTGISSLKVGIVDGADVLDRLTATDQSRLAITPLDTSGPSFNDIVGKLTSAHAYLGCEAIVSVLQQGAQIVVTGRCTDPALVLAPVMHEFNLTAGDTDALALGTVVGHVLECGAQSSGGNFLADWRSVPELAQVGFPIAEFDGVDDAVITKHEALGGLVSAATVKEQLLYEIADPRAYITADSIPDFTTIELTEEAPNRVRIRGVRGKPAPDQLKVSCIYDAGWKVSGQLTYCWPHALQKAKAAAALIQQRAEGKLGPVFDAWQFDTIGVNACHGSLTETRDPAEVVLKISARSTDRAACDYLGREIVGLILTGPPGATGYAGGRPKATPVRSVWSGLVPRDEVKPRAEVREL